MRSCFRFRYDFKMSKNQLANCASAFVSKNKGHCLLFTYNEEEKDVEIVGTDRPTDQPTDQPTNQRTECLLEATQPSLKNHQQQHGL